MIKQTATVPAGSNTMGLILPQGQRDVKKASPPESSDREKTKKGTKKPKRGQATFSAF